MNKIQYIEIIKKCPYCNNNLIIINNNNIKTLKCNNENCSQRLVNRIEHYCSKVHGLNIKGLGKQTITLLCGWGWINGLKDIYNLEQYRIEWESKPGFGKASVSKILDAIDAEGRHTELESFISAIGIPLVGRSVAKEIVKYYTTWEDFRNAVGGDWTEFEGFGPEISRSINNFDYSEADEIAAMLEFKQPEIQTKGKPAAASAIKDKIFCATGKLQNYTRDSLKAEIESLGGKMVSSVTSKVNYLITNTPNSGTQKNKDAQRLGVSIITEEDYIKMKS